MQVTQIRYGIEGEHRGSEVTLGSDCGWTSCQFSHSLYWVIRDEALNFSKAQFPHL